MFYLILLTFLVFVIFWLGDFFLTVQVARILGPKVELNPIIRVLLKTRGRFIYLFKLVELGAFLYLIWYLSTFNARGSFYILLIYILFYSLLVVNNAHVYSKITNKESTILKLVYLGLTLSILFFIYLNYLLYNDLEVSFKALGKANQQYSELYSKYNLNNESLNSLPREFTQLLDDLNITIRR